MRVRIFLFSEIVDRIFLSAISSYAAIVVHAPLRTSAFLRIKKGWLHAFLLLSSKEI
jgi:hypothetical protein